MNRTEPDVPEKKGKEIRAFSVGDRAPRIDGKLDDEIWTTAQRVEDLVQNDPDNMAAPRERTVIQVAYDDRSIYVAARCYMADPSKITTALGRRDTSPRSDWIRITFDPRHDHLTAYTFDANPSGVQGDFMWIDDMQQSRDYDGVWEVRTEITAEGWNAEFRIPFSQMRFSLVPGEETVWGFNIRRVGVIVHTQPRPAFYRYLQAIVESGFGNRVMFGSDQMVWPGAIERAIAVINEAPFLSAAERRDIFYNNAARLLRLSAEEMARHRGM